MSGRQASPRVRKHRPASAMPPPRTVRGKRLWSGPPEPAKSRPAKIRPAAFGLPRPSIRPAQPLACKRADLMRSDFSTTRTPDFGSECCFTQWADPGTPVGEGPRGRSDSGGRGTGKSQTSELQSGRSRSPKPWPASATRSRPAARRMARCRPLWFARSPRAGSRPASFSLELSTAFANLLNAEIRNDQLGSEVSPAPRSAR